MALDISCDVEQLDVVVSKMRGTSKALDDAATELKKAVSATKPLENPLTNQIVPIWEGIVPAIAQINTDWEELVKVIAALVEQQKQMKAAEEKDVLGQAFDNA